MLRESLMDYLTLLRNNLDDPADRPTTYTESRSVTDADIFPFEDNDRCKNVYWVELDGTEQVYRTDYKVNYDDQQLEVLQGTWTGTVDVKYDYGSTWVYPEFPRLEDVTLPRVSIKEVGPAQEDYTIGGERILYRRIFQTDTWCDEDTEYSYKNTRAQGPKLREFITDDLYKLVRENRTWIPRVANMRIATLTTPVEEVERKGGTRRIYRSSADVEADYFYSSSA